MTVRCQIAGCNKEGLRLHTAEYVADLAEPIETVCENEYMQHLRTGSGKDIMVKHKLNENPYIKPN